MTGRGYILQCAREIHRVPPPACTDADASPKGRRPPRPRPRPPGEPHARDLVERADVDGSPPDERAPPSSVLRGSRRHGPARTAGTAGVLIGIIRTSARPKKCCAAGDGARADRGDYGQIRPPPYGDGAPSLIARATSPASCRRGGHKRAPGPRRLLLLRPVRARRRPHDRGQHRRIGRRATLTRSQEMDVAKR
jgi:hypothetical protein